jgi:excisionase family DNA binding protein
VLKATQRTYSLAEAANEICGDSLKHPVKWLRRRIGTGEVRAYQVGRRWRMRREDIDAAMARFSNIAEGNAQGNVSQTTQQADMTPIGITPLSLRRRGVR